MLVKMGKSRSKVFKEEGHLMHIKGDTDAETEATRLYESDGHFFKKVGNDYRPARPTEEDWEKSKRPVPFKMSKSICKGCERFFDGYKWELCERCKREQ